MTDFVALLLSLGWGWGCAVCCTQAGARGFVFLGLSALPLLVWARYAPARRASLAAAGAACVPGFLLPAGPAATVLAAVILGAVVQTIFKAVPARGLFACATLGSLLSAMLLAPALFLCDWPGPTLSAESLGWAVAGSFACGASFALLERRILHSSALRHALQRP
ncbi:MAG: hypothetical protein EXS14_04655 [Planctomycetes bacterium]|nr:hypothetical protein [Planctomycetota bacterium]